MAKHGTKLEINHMAINSQYEWDDKMKKRPAANKQLTVFS